MDQKLIAFWKYDGHFPFILWGEIESITNKGDYWINDLGGAIKREYVILVLPFDEADGLIKKISDITNSYNNKMIDIKIEHKKLLNEALYKYIGKRSG